MAKTELPKPKTRHGVAPLGTCPRCGGDALYSTFEITPWIRGYDARFCPACDVWLESECSREDCEYCRKRPLRPSLVELPMVDYRDFSPPATDDVCGVAICLESHRANVGRSAPSVVDGGR